MPVIEDFQCFAIDLNVKNINTCFLVMTLRKVIVGGIPASIRGTVFGDSDALRIATYLDTHKPIIS